MGASASVEAVSSPGPASTLVPRGVYFNPASQVIVRPCEVSTSRFEIGASIVFLEVDAGPDYQKERYGIVASSPRLGDGGCHFYRVHRTVEDQMGDRTAVPERALVIAEHCLLSEEEVKERHLRQAMARLMHVVFGHAMQQWIRVTEEGRNHEEAMTAALMVQSRWRGVATRNLVKAKKKALREAATKARLAYEEEQKRLSDVAAIAAAAKARAEWEAARAKPPWEIEAAGRVEEHVAVAEPHFSAKNVRIPALPTTGSECTLSGVIRITDSSAHMKFKRIIAGPLDRSNWMVKGRVLLGAFPRDDLQAEIGATAKAHGHMIGTIISHGISAFVCLMTQAELKALPPRASTSKGAVSQEQIPVGDFEPIFRLHCARMKGELRNGVAATEKALELSQKMRDRALEEGYAADILATYTDRLRYAQKCHGIVKKKFDHVPEPDALLFSTVEWPDGEIIANEALLASLKQTEERLREGRKVYIFSANGRGRGGVYAACLLGRLYGLHADDALSRLQIYHDTRRSLQKGDAGKDSAHRVALSTPSSAVQAHQVRTMLNTYSTVFNSRELLSTDCAARSVVTHRKRGTAQLVYTKVASPSGGHSANASPRGSPRRGRDGTPRGGAASPPLSPRLKFGDRQWDGPVPVLNLPSSDDSTHPEHHRTDDVCRSPRTRSEALPQPATSDARRARVAALRAQVHGELSVTTVGEF